MSATLEFLNFMKAIALGPPGGVGSPRTTSLRPGGTTGDPPETDEQKVYRERLEGISRNLQDETAFAEAARGERFKEHATAYKREQDKPKDWKEDLAQKVRRSPSEAVGALGSASKFATEVGSASAQQAQQAGQIPQGSLTQGTGTAPGKAGAFARQKGAQAPRLQGKVPSMSTKVKMNKPPKVATPQQMPGMKMEKEDDEGYNTKGARREAKRRKDRKMKVTGKSVQTFEQIIADRAKKLKGEE